MKTRLDSLVNGTPYFKFIGVAASRSMSAMIIYVVDTAIYQIL